MKLWKKKADINNSGDGKDLNAEVIGGGEEKAEVKAPKPKRRAREVALIALFVAITVVFGFIKIPMQPVAMSLLTLATALAGCFLSPLSAALSQIIYVVMGLIGIPVFTAGGGFAYVLQPSFGFLLFLPFMVFY